MRDLNECTAEVFRRGEQRIKERGRKRRRVLAVCIPVCLFAAVWPAIIFPPMTPEMGTDHFVQPDGETAVSAPESLACPYTAVEIQASGLFQDGHYGKVTDQLAVAEMFRAVESLFAGDSLFADAAGNGPTAGENYPSDENFPAEENSKNDNLAESAGKWKGCTITFTAQDGSQAVYLFSGNTLADADTNETVFLSGPQAAELMAVLGISE